MAANPTYTSKLPHETQFGAVAFVILGLGVGHAGFVDKHQLGAEAQEGEGAV